MKLYISSQNHEPKIKKRLLEAVNTGDEQVDAQIRYQVEAYNKIANDLDELISPQRIQTSNRLVYKRLKKQDVENKLKRN